MGTARILQLQKNLKRDGFDPGTLDGSMGPKTQAALEAWRAWASGLPRGIDTARYQAEVDWKAVHDDGVSFAIVKATQGTGRDALFKTNFSGAKAANLIVGVYHWYSPAVGIEPQAQAIFGAVGKLGPGDLPVSIDVERDSVGADGVLGTRDDIKATDGNIELLTRRVEELTGKVPFIYSYRFYIDERDIEVPWCPLWHAEYVSDQPPTIAPGWRTWAMHQYAGNNGRQKGVKGAVDLNRFNGTVDQLRALAGL
jgi:lysozyme